MTPWGVSPTTVGRLLACGAPWSLMLMIQYLVSLKGGIIRRDLDCVEMFSGLGELSNQFQVEGMASQSYDIADNVLTCDFTTDLGFLNSLWLVLRLKQGGLLWGGVPCSSFVWMNMGTSLRSEAGHVSFPTHRPLVACQ